MTIEVALMGIVETMLPAPSMAGAEPPKVVTIVPSLVQVAVMTTLVPLGEAGA